MSKRSKFVLASFFLGVLLWLSSLVGADSRLALVLAVSAVAYVVSVWVLFEDLKGVEWVTLMILPVMFTLSSGLFANFLPQAIPSFLGANFQIETSLVLGKLVSILFFLLYVVGMYAIFLIENIFSVASIRTIQLLRAARSVCFVMTLLAGMFFYTVALSLRVPFWSIGLIAGFSSWILSLGNYWSADLKGERRVDVKKFALVTGWLMFFAGMVMAFWPVKPFMGALMLMAVFYALLGMLEQRLKYRVYGETMLEYIVFSIIILFVGYLTTSWRG